MKKNRSNPFSFFRSGSGPAIVLDKLGDNGASCGWIKVSVPKDLRIYKKFSNCLHYLIKNHYVDFKKEKGTEVTLLPKGKIVYSRTKVLRSSLLPENRFCLVVFDIPENKRRLRELLRAFLDECGFIPLQKSVWISQFNATKELSEFFEFLGLEEYIRVFTVINDNCP